MGRTPDRFPGEREDESLYLEPGTVRPSRDGEVFYVAGEGFRFQEGGVEKGIGGSGSGLTEGQHRTLRQLIHLVETGPMEGFPSGTYRETTGGVFPTAVVWWESAAKLKKILEKTITWSGAFPVTIAWKAYDTDGNLLVTVTDSITYSGALETSRTRTIA